MFHRILAIILGVLMIGTGIWCVCMPLDVYSTLPVMLGIALLADGIGSVLSWFALRPVQGGAFLLINAILSVLLGVILLGNDVLQMGFMLSFATFISIWILISGILHIIASFRVRSLKQAQPAPLRRVGTGWWIWLIIGILLIAAGIVSFSEPFGVMIAVGVYMGIDIIAGGAGLIALALIA